MSLANYLMLLFLFSVFSLSIQQASPVVFHPTTPTSNTTLTLKLYTPPQQYQSLTQPNKNKNTTAILFKQQEDQCDCYACVCVGSLSGPCPRSIPVRNFVVIAYREECAENNVLNNVAVELINIMSINLDGFKYFLVDETNKNLALSGQRFEYNSLKSNDVESTCVYDNTPAIRIPKKAYIVARSTNVIYDTHVKFKIIMKCSPARFTKIEFTTSSSSHDKEYYVGVTAYLYFKFLIDDNNIDTMQKGQLEFDGTSHPLDGGKGYIQFTPSKLGTLKLSVRYIPDPSIFGSPVSLETSITVFEQGMLTIIWEWIWRTSDNTIISIVMLSAIVVCVLVLCIIGCVCLICWRIRKRRAESSRGEIDKLKYELVDD